MMFELPLFPLNIVLFPGMPLALHIFEERYKRMIDRCIEQGIPFGVVLIKGGVEALGPLARTHEIGCTAQITLVERLKEGRMNIGAVGRERFRINALSEKDGYLLGQAERYPLETQESAGQKAAAERLRPWVERYLEQLVEVEGALSPPQHLSKDPQALGQAAAALLQIPVEEKQKLLETGGLLALLTGLRPLYRREVAFMESMMRQRRALEQKPAEGSLFSLN